MPKKEKEKLSAKERAKEKADAANRAKRKAWLEYAEHNIPVPVPLPTPKPAVEYVPYLVRVLHYHEIFGKSKLEGEAGKKVSPPARALAIPSTVKLLADNKKASSPFPQAWQDYWIELVSHQIRLQNLNAPENSIRIVAVKCFEYAFRSNTVMCNKHGGTYGGKDIQLECITMGGNIHTVTGNSKIIAGVKCLPVRVCNSQAQPPQVGDFSGNIWGTIETNIIKGANKRDRIVRSFESLNFIKEKLPVGITRTSTNCIPYTLLANGCDIAWIPASRTIPITLFAAWHYNTFE